MIALTESVNQKMEMPKMDEDTFKASIYGHLHQFAEWENVQGFRLEKEFLGYTFDLKQYFIATFYPQKGEYHVTCPEESLDEITMVFSRMLNCEHCRENKDEILEAKPDYFEGEVPERDTNKKTGAEGGSQSS